MFTCAHGVLCNTGVIFSGVYSVSVCRDVCLSVRRNFWQLLLMTIRILTLKLLLIRYVLYCVLVKAISVITVFILYFLLCVVCHFGD